MMSQPHHPHTPLFKTFIDRKIAPQIARKQTRDTHISWEDALQTAYTKLWQATTQDRFRHGTPDDYCRWAARVCAFAIKDHLGHSQNNSPTTASTSRSPAPTSPSSKPLPTNSTASTPSIAPTYYQQSLIY
jgi:hypothetical protein